MKTTQKKSLAFCCLYGMCVLIRNMNNFFFFYRVDMWEDKDDKRRLLLQLITGI